jgi:azurin
MHKEQRKHTRLTLHAKATIQIGDQSIEAESENVSLKGAFVAAVKRVELNDEVEFNFSDIPISAKAKVVRVTDKGVGLQFENTLLG